MTEFIRRMPRRMQVELAASGIKYANRTRNDALRDMKNGGYDYYFAGDNWDDFATADDVAETNRINREKAPKLRTPSRLAAPIFGLAQPQGYGFIPPTSSAVAAANLQNQMIQNQNQEFFDEVRSEQNHMAQAILDQQAMIKDINGVRTGNRPVEREYDDKQRLKDYRDRIRQGYVDLDDIAYGGADYAFNQLEERRKEREAEINKSKLLGSKAGYQIKREGLDPLDPNDEERIEEIKRDNETALETAQRYAMQPAKLMSATIKTIDDTLYRVLFGANEEEGSILNVLADNIKSVFSNLKDWLYKDIYSPLKRWFFGDDFTQTKFYKFFYGLFDRLRGTKDENGYYSKGVLSDVYNEFKDSGNAIRNIVSGEGYTDSHGNKVAENKDSVFDNMRQGVNDVFGSFKNYWGAGNEDKNPNAWKDSMLKSVNGHSSAVPPRNTSPIAGSMAAGGGVYEPGSYLLTKGEKVVKGNFALGTVPKTGIYNLNAGDEVVPNNDVVASLKSESSFLFDLLNKTYGSLAEKLDNVVSAINRTTDSIEAGFTSSNIAQSKTADAVTEASAKNDEQVQKELARKDAELKINNLISSITKLDGTRKEKKPFIDVIFDNLVGAGSKFAGAIGGSRNFDNTYVQKEYAKIIRAKAPKAIAHGTLAGGGLALAGGAGAAAAATGATVGPFGALSFLLPGGPFSSMLVGLGLGILHQNESFMNMMYGKKNDKGERQGGIISKNTQKFLKENKTGLIGGAMMGVINGLTGFSVLGLLSHILPGGVGGALGTIGLVPTFGIGLLGPVLFYSAAGLALKSKAFHNLLFGTGDPKDGKKATGALNGATAKKMKRILPNVAVGAGLGALAGGATSGMGILGAFALGPYTMALAGGAIGLGMASDRFKDAIFGKYDDKKKKFVSGGLVDVMKNAIKGEILKPVGVFAEQSIAKMRHFIATDILVPLAKGLYPFVALGKTIFDSITTKVKGILTGAGNAIYSTFNAILTPFKFLFKKAWDWTWGASKSLLNGIF